MVLFCRILDNLPLVVPVQRPDQDNVVVYQHGFHVGLKGIFVGVRALSYVFMFIKGRRSSGSYLLYSLVSCRKKRRNILSTTT